MSFARKRRLGLFAPLIIATMLGATLSACSSSSSGDSAGTSPTGATGSSAADLPAPSVDPALNAMLPESFRKGGEISWLVQIPAAPMEYKENGKLTGVDIDLGNAIIAKLGLKPKMSTVNDFAQLVPAISTNRADFVMSGMKDLKSRQGALDFIDYFKTGNLFLGKAADAAGFKSYQDLCGKTVNSGVGASYTQQLAELSKAECEAKGKPAIINISAGASLAEQALQLEQGRAVAILNGVEISATFCADSNGKYVLYDIPAFEAAYYGIAINKSNPQLASAMQASLQALMDDGTYTKILAKYNLASAALTKATINGALS